jgi:hypothetical protein
MEKKIRQKRYQHLLSFQTRDPGYHTGSIIHQKSVKPSP